MTDQQTQNARSGATIDKWEEDANGFLRIRARVIQAGIMGYAGKELGDANRKAAKASNTDVVDIYVPPEEIFDPAAMYSLEGIPVTVDHTWIRPGEKRKTVEVGNIAGAPRQNGPYLEADILVRDPDAISAIKNGNLKEISSAYGTLYEMTPGRYSARDYSGSQRRIRFNHVALLPEGKGRGGPEIRVLNEDGATPEEPAPMADTPTTNIQTVSLPDGRSIRVAAEDAAVLQAQFGAMNAAAETADSDAEKAANTIATNEKALADMTAERDKLAGELETVKGELKTATDPSQIQNAVAQMATDQATAVAILVANKVADDREEAQEMVDGFAGHELRVGVINAVRYERGQPILTDEQASNEAYVEGAYEAVAAGVPDDDDGGDRRQVAGASVVLNMMGGKGKMKSGMKNMKMRGKKNMKMENEDDDPLGYAAHAKHKKMMKNRGAMPNGKMMEDM